MEAEPESEIEVEAEVESDWGDFETGLKRIFVSTGVAI